MFQGLFPSKLIGKHDPFVSFMRESFEDRNHPNDMLDAYSHRETYIYRASLVTRCRIL